MMASAVQGFFEIQIAVAPPRAVIRKLAIKYTGDLSNLSQGDWLRGFTCGPSGSKGKRPLAHDQSEPQVFATLLSFNTDQLGSGTAHGDSRRTMLIWIPYKNYIWYRVRITAPG